MRLTHFVTMQRGILRPACGTTCGVFGRGPQDDVVTCAICQVFVEDLLRDADDGVELSLTRAPDDGGWKVRPGTC